MFDSHRLQRKFWKACGSLVDQGQLNSKMNHAAHRLILKNIRDQKFSILVLKLNHFLKMFLNIALPIF